jgi:formamidopyrimidine-DNA glycosylase
VPELPDVTVYAERIAALLGGQRLERLTILSPFVLRSVAPPPAALGGRRLLGASRLGKRMVLHFKDDLFAVIHLMIAGRLHLGPPGSAAGGRARLAAFAFPANTLTLTEQGTTRRASLHLTAGREGLAAFAREGVDPLTASAEALAAALRRRNRTLKRALTDPDVVDGVGNAYSDEILHRARLSPFRQTAAMDEEEVRRLSDAARAVLSEWTDRLRAEAGAGFPERVTAFRPGMAVHGRYRQPCPDCGEPVQRIRYADHEANYCAACQTGGRLLADRALSRLMRDDWPRTLAELEEVRPARPS